MPRLVLDSINFEAVSATRWPHLIGYVNGRISAWSPAQITQARSRGQLLGLVDVLGNEPKTASILDFERGDVQSPAVVHAWVQARNQFRGDAVVYCAPRSIATVVGGLRGEPCMLWVVDLTQDGEPPFTPPHYPGLPGNVKVIGRQFVFGPRSGGAYDLSVFYDDDWHPEQDHARHYAAARIAAAPELGKFAAAAAGEQLPGQLEIPGTAPAPVSLGLATLTAGLGLPDPAAALTYPPLGGMVPAAQMGSSSTAAADVDQAAAAAASTPGADAGNLQAAEPSGALTGTDPAYVPDAAQPKLNHAYIGRVLLDVGHVAGEFRRVGKPGMAVVLELAAALAEELGRELQAADR